MVKELDAAVFSKLEFLPPIHVYVLTRGVCSYNGKLLATGRVWGLESMTYSVHLPRKVSRVLTEALEVLFIDALRVRALAEEHDPDAAHRIRWFCAKEALCKYVVAVLRARKAAEEQEPQRPSRPSRPSAAAPPLHKGAAGKNRVLSSKGAGPRRGSVSKMGASRRGSFGISKMGGVTADDEEASHRSAAVRRSVENAKAMQARGAMELHDEMRVEVQEVKTHVAELEKQMGAILRGVNSLLRSRSEAALEVETARSHARAAPYGAKPERTNSAAPPAEAEAACDGAGARRAAAPCKVGKQSSTTTQPPHATTDLAAASPAAEPASAAPAAAPAPASSRRTAAGPPPSDLYIV
jgi:hypothetical protein